MGVKYPGLAAMTAGMLEPMAIMPCEFDLKNEVYSGVPVYGVAVQLITPPICPLQINGANPLGLAATWLSRTGRIFCGSLKELMTYVLNP
jgi:hypothetical protein